MEVFMAKLFILTSKLLYENGNVVFVPEDFVFHSEDEMKERTRRIIENTGVRDISELEFYWKEMVQYSDSDAYARNFLRDRKKERAI